MRRPHCQACTNEKYGINPKISVDHVCEKSDSKYTPPEIRNYLGKDQVYVRITSLLHDTGKASRWKVKNRQWINGYRVNASNNELWIPNHIHSFNDRVVDKGVWIDKDFYDKMAFV
jgi:glyoxylate carboligase